MAASDDSDSGGGSGVSARRMRELEDAHHELEGRVRDDHDMLIRHDGLIQGLREAHEKGGSRMWQLVMFGLATLASVGGFIATMLKGAGK